MVQTLDLGIEALTKLKKNLVRHDMKYHDIHLKSYILWGTVLAAILSIRQKPVHTVQGHRVTTILVKVKDFWEMSSGLWCKTILNTFNI